MWALLQALDGKPNLPKIGTAMSGAAVDNAALRRRATSLSTPQG